jgi:hypothetical protein
VSLAEGALAQLPGLERFDPGGVGSGPPPARGRDRDPTPRERVDSQVYRQEPALVRSRKGFSRSRGAGKTIVVDCELPSSSRVCR